MWLPKSTYFQLKEQERSWKKVKKTGRGFLPLRVYIEQKQMASNQVLVYIPGDHIGKIEDSPVFYLPLGNHLLQRFISSNKKTTLVKHLPRGTTKAGVDRDWWRGRFGTPA